jgi:molybdate-binding protein/DNA-binding XRE family transcriptional regulator
MNRLANTRQSRGIAAADLAVQVGVRRQTIYAIEAGAYLPNTELALRLAHALGVPVGQLFSLNEPTRRLSAPDAAVLGDESGIAAGTSVHVCRVGDQWVGIPVSAAPYHLPVGDGVIAQHQAVLRAPRITLVEPFGEIEERLVIAGCDPAALLLARLVADVSGVRVVAAGGASRAAIRMVCGNRAHVAGTHLEDDDTGEFNVALLRGNPPLEGAVVFTMARWEAGLVVAAGNPRHLRRIDDLARPDVTFINREAGSGSRALLNKLMGKAGVTAAAVRGFDRTAGGHLAAAYRVASGDADACLATRSAARSFGLDFVPLQEERYDFVIPRPYQQVPAVVTFLDVIQRGSVRRRFAALTSYDTTEMGRQIA